MFGKAIKSTADKVERFIHTNEDNCGSCHYYRPQYGECHSSPGFVDKVRKNDSCGGVDYKKA